MLYVCIKKLAIRPAFLCSAADEFRRNRLRCTPRKRTSQRRKIQPCLQPLQRARAAKRLQSSGSAKPLLVVRREDDLEYDRQDREIFCCSLFRVLVEEVAGHQYSGDENKQQSQVQAGAVQFDRKVVRIGVAFHDLGSAADELHRGKSAEEKHSGNAKCV